MYSPSAKKRLTVSLLGHSAPEVSTNDRSTSRRLSRVQSPLAEMPCLSATLAFEVPGASTDIYIYMKDANC